MLILYTDADFFGGAEVALRDLGRRMADAGVDVTVLGTTAEVVQLAAAPGVKADVITERGFWPMVLGHRRRFAPADVVHVSMRHVAACRTALTALATCRRPTVVAHFQLPLFPVPTPWRQRAQRLLLRRVDHRLAAGRRSAAAVSELLGLPPEAFVPGPNVVPDTGPEDSRTARSCPTIELVCIARHAIQKRLDVLLEALARLPDQYHLTIIGHGPLTTELVELADQLGVTDRVTFERDSFDGNARLRLGDHDVFVLSSDYEGSPLVIAEAMLAQLPVVATDVGGVAEQVQHGVTGLVVPPGSPECLARAIAEMASPDHRARLGRAARSYALEHLVPECDDDVVSALHRQLAGLPSPR